MTLFPSWRSFFLGSIFLLFPIAHIKLSESWPIYPSEGALLVAIGVTLWPLRQQIVHETKWFSLPFVLPLLFLGGVGLSFWINELPLSALGLVKSFIILPCLLAWTLTFTMFSTEEHRAILKLWYLGIAAAALAALLAALAGFLTYDGRLASLYLSPNHLAMLLAPGVIIGSVLVGGAGQSRSRLLWLTVTLMIFVALLLTRSYGSLIALGPALFLLGRLMGWSWARNILPAVGVVLILLTLWLIGEATSGKWATFQAVPERSSLASRGMIWEAAVAILEDHPLLGIGIGQFQTSYLAYQPLFPPYLEWAVPEPHNVYLSWWLTGGILGVVGILGSCVLAWRGLSRVIRSSTDPRKRWLAACYLALLIWWLVVGMIDTPYFKNDLAFGFWGLIGLAWVLSSLTAVPHVSRTTTN